jgi:hypothetical protein
VEEKGTHADDDNIDAKRKSSVLPGETELPPMGIDDRSLEPMSNWSSACARAPAATRHSSRRLRAFGRVHDVHQAYWSGEKQYWDAKNEMIIDLVPGA